MQTVAVSSIVVEDRCRKDLGDIAPLARSIAEVGLLHPVVVTPDLRLVAGERRLAAVKHLGWTEVPVGIAENLDGALLLLRAERDENTARKELSATEAVALGERIESVERPAAEERQASTQLRGRDGFGNPVFGGGKLPSPNGKQPQVRDKVADAIGGMSGRTYEKAKSVVTAAKEQPEAFGDLPALMDATGKVDKAFNALKKRKQEQQDSAKAEEVENTQDRFAVYHCAVESLSGKVDAETLDAIITDPPYPEEFLPVYGALAQFALHALKPGGSLLAMVGQAHLPEVLRRLSVDGLQYHWTVAYVMPGATAKMWGRKLIVGWKPVLWFVKGEGWDPSSGEMPTDIVQSAARNKDHHHWGQSESGMAQLVEKVTSPGDIVCDPFCGGGSTGVAAVGLQRFFIGADAAEEAVNRTLVRLAEAYG